MLCLGRGVLHGTYVCTHRLRFALRAADALAWACSSPSRPHALQHLFLRGHSGELSIPAMPLERILFWASNKDNLSQSYMLPGMVDLLSSLSRESVMHNKAEEEDLLEGVGQGIEILDSVSVVHATLHILTGVAESLLDGTRDSAVARTSHPRFQETQPPSNLFPNSN